jgi:3-phenylpropionate/trans-cinnamate dioxygenase ferredoxin reductase subunit
VPNVELARDAALPVANGVAVDEFLRTADENIYAIGDCAEHPCHFTRARVRLESVQNAADQAQHVAATIAGHSGRYEALPWFWTDQFDTKLQIAGISQGHDRAEIRGNAATGKFSVFYYREGCLIAVDSVNRPMDHMLSRKLISANAPLTPEQVADESFDLRQFAAKLPRR